MNGFMYVLLKEYMDCIVIGREIDVFLNMLFFR